MIKMSEEMKKNEAVKETTVNEETKEEIKEECKDEKKVEPQEEDEVTKLNKQIETNFHQAMMSEHIEGVEPGTVTTVLQKGYILKDRLLRAAMVKVSE